MKHSLVTIANLSKDKIMYLIEMAQAFEKNPNRESRRNALLRAVNAYAPFV